MLNATVNFRRYVVRSPSRLPVAYAAIVDRRGWELLITDTMVRDACATLDSAQEFPFAPNPRATSE